VASHPVVDDSLSPDARPHTAIEPGATRKLKCRLTALVLRHHTFDGCLPGFEFFCRGLRNRAPRLDYLEQALQLLVAFLAFRIEKVVCIPAVCEDSHPLKWEVFGD
jgi:hypothetical protein